MPLRISRALPPSGSPFRYEVYRGPDAKSLLLLDGVPFAGHSDAQGFFYVDASGDVTMWYRTIAYDADNVILDDSGPYAFSPNAAALVPTKVRVDHDYGAKDALRYVAESGMGIPQAKIYVWTLPDYQQGLLDNAVASTLTDDDGRWVAPAYLTPGFSYAIVFQKEGSYGPTLQTIVVGPA